MANNITNRITVNGSPEMIEKFFDFIRSDKGTPNNDKSLIDFNKIIPMPESLNIPASSDGEEAAAWVAVNERNLPDPREYGGKFCKYERIKSDPVELEAYLKEGRIRMDNLHNYGHQDWYGWRREHWGAKWNAYESYRLADNIIEFQTAWHGVPKLVSVLAQRFPDLSIDYMFADEDLGCNTGSFNFKGESVYDMSPENDTEESWDIVFELGLADKEEFVQTTAGNYRWKEDEVLNNGE